MHRFGGEKENVLALGGEITSCMMGKSMGTSKYNSSKPCK